MILTIAEQEELIMEHGIDAYLQYMEYAEYNGWEDDFPENEDSPLYGSVEAEESEVEEEHQ